MAKAENPRAVAGGNNPPSQEELMREKFAPLIVRLEALRADALPLPVVIKNEAHLTAVTAVVLKLRDLAKDERKAFTGEKEYWLQGGRAVDSFFNTTLRDPVTELGKALQKRCDDFTAEKVAEERRKAAEKARKEAEEAERQRQLAEKHAGTGRASQHETRAEVAESRAEEAGAAASASAADLTRTTLASGATASARETWTGAISDFTALVATLGPLGPYLKPAEIEGAVARMAKATEGRVALPGVKFDKSISANIRKR